jgi:CRISPR/Cas system CSM-associated protein Csm2 small subunit
LNLNDIQRREREREREKDWIKRNNQKNNYDRPLNSNKNPKAQKANLSQNQKEKAYNNVLFKSNKTIKKRSEV